MMIVAALDVKRPADSNRAFTLPDWKVSKWVRRSEAIPDFFILSIGLFFVFGCSAKDP